ncbi:MAG: hypothetical protein ACRDQA_03135 [Nocardioidaceae bacterium]
MTATHATATKSHVTPATVALGVLSIAAWLVALHIWPQHAGIYTRWPLPYESAWQLGAAYIAFTVPVLLTLAAWVRFDRARHQ